MKKILIITFIKLSVLTFGQSISEKCKAKFQAGDFLNAKADCVLASQSGDSISQTYLGIIYLSESVTDSAKIWFEKSAKLGDPSGQNGLGYLYQNGLGGLPTDLEKANELFLKSAKQGNSDSQFWLGQNLFLSGNKKEGYAWTLKASLNGSRDAQFNLGAMLQNGDGTTKDETAAIIWLLISATNGNEKSKDFIDSLEARTSNEQFQKYIKLTEDFIRQNPLVIN
jgi:TPR repeat protein